MAPYRRDERRLSKPVIFTITGLVVAVIALLITVFVLISGSSRASLDSSSLYDGETHFRHTEVNFDSDADADLGPAIVINADGFLVINEWEVRPLAIAAIRTMATKSKHTPEQVEKLLKNRHYIRLAETALRTLVPDTKWEDLKDDIDELITMFALQKGYKGAKKWTGLLSQPHA